MKKKNLSILLVISLLFTISNFLYAQKSRDRSERRGSRNRNSARTSPGRNTGRIRSTAPVEQERIAPVGNANENLPQRREYSVPQRTPSIRREDNRPERNIAPIRTQRQEQRKTVQPVNRERQRPTVSSGERLKKRPVIKNELKSPSNEADTQAEQLIPNRRIERPQRRNQERRPALQPVIKSTQTEKPATNQNVQEQSTVQEKRRRPRRAPTTQETPRRPVIVRPEIKRPERRPDTERPERKRPERRPAITRPESSGTVRRRRPARPSQGSSQLLPDSPPTESQNVPKKPDRSHRNKMPTKAGIIRPYRPDTSKKWTRPSNVSSRKPSKKKPPAYLRRPSAPKPVKIPKKRHRTVVYRNYYYPVSSFWYYRHFPRYYSDWWWYYPFYYPFRTNYVFQSHHYYNTIQTLQTVDENNYFEEAQEEPEQIEIILNSREKYEFTLEEYLDSSYNWLVKYDAHYCNVEIVREQKLLFNENFPNATSFAKISIEPIRNGNTIIELIYARPWEYENEQEPEEIKEIFLEIDIRD